MRPDAPIRAWVGLGGNEGDISTTLEEALWALDALPQTTIQQQSGFYRTPAWGRTDQPDFINAVVELRTRTAPRALLELLLRRKGEVLPRSLIASQVWDMNFDSDTNVIEVAMRRLRLKIDEGQDVKLIQTVRGMGYVLEAPESV